MTRALGIDVGATKIAAAVVEPETGRIDRRDSVLTRPDRGGDAVLDSCVRLAEAVIAEEPVDAIGIGVPELVDLDGRVTSAYSFDWRGRDVAAEFQHLAPITIQSDVRAAALAEATFGAGKATRLVFFVNAGSGISSCLVIDGVPYAGSRGNAILIGGGPLDVEPLSGGTGIAARAGAESAAEVSRAADEGDSGAMDLILEAGRALGEATAFAVNLLDPDVVVLGGGVALGSGPYRNAFDQAVRAHVWSADTRKVPIVSAVLGSDAGVIGAALAASRLPVEVLR